MGNNIYNAIMKAADHIEAKPHLFNFESPMVPKADCGTPGCALGWIGFFAGSKEPDYRHVAENDLRLPVEPWNQRTTMVASAYAFYNRMDNLCAGRTSWMYSAAKCAQTLRLYAERHHARERPQKALIPDWQTIATSPLIPDHVRSEEVA